MQASLSKLFALIIISLFLLLDKWSVFECYCDRIMYYPYPIELVHLQPMSIKLKMTTKWIQTWLKTKICPWIRSQNCFISARDYQLFLQMSGFWKAFNLWNVILFMVKIITNVKYCPFSLIFKIEANVNLKLKHIRMNKGFKSQFWIVETLKITLHIFFRSQRNEKTA